MAVSTNAASATLLDDFNRSNEGPPPSASWLSSSFSSGTSQLQVVSNALKRGGAGWGSCVWGATFGANTILVVTISTVGDFSLIIRGQSPGSAAWDGYELLYTSSTHRFDIDRIDNNATTSLANTTAVTLSNGDKVGFEIVGSNLAAARYTAGAWGADFLTASDATYASSGYVGVWANGTTPVFDDFSAGTIPAAGKSPAYPRRDSMRLNALLRR